MNIRRISLLPLLCGGLLLVGAGCVTIGTGQGLGAGDGGIYKSANKGDSWQQQAAILSVGQNRPSINGTSVDFITQDPEDANAVYIGTVDNGLFYSYDGGESWQQPAQISRGRIPYIAVHPRNKCIIYVCADNKLLKSVDCSRTWAAPFLDARTNLKTKAVAVDSYDPEVVWLATSAGDLLKSADGGASWSTVKNFNNDDILRLVVSPADTRHVYVATKNNGLWRTVDGGVKWTDLSQNKGYKDLAGAREFYDLAVSVSEPNTMIIASKYGLLRTTDGGDTWAKIDLLTPPGSTVIYSLAVDPKDPNNIYYGTSTTFYRSPNGGVNWVPKKLPTSRSATFLLVDQLNSSAIFMGVTKFNK